MRYTNYMEAALAPAEATYKRTIMHDTFGHLRPKPAVVYTGYILFAHACDGLHCVIDYDFADPDGKLLDGSPWLWEAVNAYISNKILPDDAFESVLPAGRVYLWRGTCRFAADKTNDDTARAVEGKARFRGRVLRVKTAIKTRPTKS